MLIDWIYPPRCPLCRRILANTGEVCPDCFPQGYLPENEQPGRGDLHISFLYDGRMQKAIESFKYEGKKIYAHSLGQWMLREGTEFLTEHSGIDVVTAVPLSPKRYRQRGYNQAKLLAREIAGGLHKPYVTLLERPRDTRALKGLGRQGRSEELFGAFRPLTILKTLAAEAPNLTILLIDDILTTGATMDACEAAIHSAAPDAKVIQWALSGPPVG